MPAAWSESEQEYLLSLVPAQIGPWAHWDYIAACMMNQFGPTRVYNGPVVRAQFLRLRHRWRYDLEPNAFCYGPEPIATDTPSASHADTVWAPTSSPPPRSLSPVLPPVCEDPEPGSHAKVRILDRIGPRMEYRFVQAECLLSDSESESGARPLDRLTPTQDGGARVPITESSSLQSLPGGAAAADAAPSKAPVESSSRQAAVFRRNYTKWSADEEMALQEIVKENPLDWELIMRRMQTRFPHGRNYTVGSLKKKVQYVPVGRSPTQYLWTVAPAERNTPLSLMQMQPAPPDLRGDCDPGAKGLVADVPASYSPLLMPSAAAYPAAARARAEFGSYTAFSEPNYGAANGQLLAAAQPGVMRDQAALGSASPLQSVKPRPSGTDPSGQPPSSTATPASPGPPSLESTSLHSASETIAFDERLLAVAIARVVHDLGLAEVELEVRSSGPSLPVPFEPGGNVSSGRVTFPGRGTDVLRPDLLNDHHLKLPIRSETTRGRL